MLPQSMRAHLSARLLRTRALWRDDRERGRGGVHLPDALERKYPRAAMAWGCFWVWPSERMSIDPQTGVVRRHHLFDQRRPWAS